MPAPRRVLLVGSLALILTAAVWWAGSRDDRAMLPKAEARPSPRSAETVIPPRLSGATRASDSKESSFEAEPRLASPEAHLAGESKVSSAERGTGARRHVHGTVLSRRGKLPFEAVVVEAIARIAGRDGEERWTTQATTDKTGAFTLHLPTDVWKSDGRYELEVTSGPTWGRPRLLLRETRTLDDGMEVLIRLEQSLHGVLAFEPARPDGDLRVELAQGIRSGIGTSVVGPDGSFEVDASPHALPSGEFDLPATIQLRCRGPMQMIAEAEVEVRRLASEDGAVIPIRLCEVEVRVAVPGLKLPAQVRAFTTGTSQQIFFGRVREDPSALSFTAQQGAIVVRIEDAMHAPQEKAARARPGAKTIVEFQSPPTTLEDVTGSVLDDRDAPLPRVHVHAERPGDSDDARSGAPGGVSDEHGVFHLRLDPGLVWVIEAQEGARSDRVTWMSGSRSPRLHLRQSAALVWEFPARCCSIALCGADGSLEVRDTADEGERMVNWLVAGDYSVFARSRTPSLASSATVRLEAGKTAHVSFDVHPAHWAHAHVASASGDCASLQVLLDAPEWPAALRAVWGRAWTATDGSFELFLGEHPTGRVHVLRDGVDLGAFDIAANATNELRVP